LDYTYKKFKHLLQTLHSQGFFFYTVREYFEGKANQTPFIMLRHDVEAKYENALNFARLQHEMGIKGTYYFRIYHKKGNEEIIKEIASLGHEIGYHYDDLSACSGNFEKAWDRFNKNLAYLRRFAEVKTMTMEGAPLSRYDNRDLWTGKIEDQQSIIDDRQSVSALPLAQGDRQKLPPKSRMYIPSNPPSSSPSPETQSPSTPATIKKFDYRKLGIIAEPYFDLDFNEIFYITDTGRRWDGHLFNLRDKATKENPVTNPEFLKLRFHSTQDIINAIENDTFPKQAMLNFHPQRWNDNLIPWLKELIWQNVKNQGKRMLLAIRQ